MRTSLYVPDGRLQVLALGAHADDIEIGCGATLLRLAAERELHVHWMVFCSTPERAVEAQASAADFLRNAASARVVVRAHRDGFLPWNGAALKEEFEALKKEVAPDVVLTHYRDDRHQDHRTVSELTWNTFRDHMILEYEIPKYDGDFGSPNVFAPVSTNVLSQKIDLLIQHYQTQKNKQWFGEELFRSVARIRGMECVAPDGFAEGFYCRKAVF